MLCERQRSVWVRTSEKRFQSQSSEPVNTIQTIATLKCPHKIIQDFSKDLYQRNQSVRQEVLKPIQKGGPCGGRLF